MDDIAELLLTYASAMRTSLEGEADALDLRVGPRMCIEAMTRAAAEITRLREALAQSPEDAEWLRDHVRVYRKRRHNRFADRLEAIANRLSGVRE